MRSELDHLVFGCAGLEAGVRWIEERLGVAPVPGGRHLAMGTHNALLRLGPRAYLELIAIDPEGTAPARPRWFALDEPEMQQRLAQSPALITWALRTGSLANACARVPDLGEILLLSRNDFRWKIAVPESGGPRGRGFWRRQTAAPSFSARSAPSVPQSRRNSSIFSRPGR